MLKLARHYRALRDQCPPLEQYLIVDLGQTAILQLWKNHHHLLSYSKTQNRLLMELAIKFYWWWSGRTNFDCSFKSDK